MKQWQPGEMLTAMRAWHRQKGVAPTHRDWQVPTPSHPSSEDVTEVFGFWSAALTAAGIGDIRDEAELEDAMAKVALHLHSERGLTEQQIARALRVPREQARGWLPAQDVPQMELFMP